MLCPKCGINSENGLTVCSECNSLLDQKPPKKKMYILTKILIGCFVTMVSIYILAIVFASSFNISNDMLYTIFEMFFFAILIALPFLAIASLIRISLNSERLKGRIVGVLFLVISCFLIYEVSYMMVPRARKRVPYRIVCGTNLKGLGTALAVYANDYDDVLPSDNWCDRLIEEADISPRSLQCHETDSEEGESDYCLNKYAAGKQLSELPKDMVLLFESKFIPAQNQVRLPIHNREGFSDLEVVSDIFRGDEEVYLNQWNQVGGPELLAYDRHEDGCNFLFAGGHSEFIKQSEFSTLRWNIEGDVSYDLSLLKAEKPSIVFQKAILLTIMGGLCLVVTLYILVKFKTIKYLPFVLGIAILSAGTGLFFGNMSEAAYLSIGTTGRNAGGVFGLLVGICFAVLLANIPDRIKSLKTFKGFSTSVGMVTGIICSTLVHLALIIVNKETNFAGILIGIPYGIFAGAVLGFISGLLVKKFYSPKPPVNIEVESN